MAYDRLRWLKECHEEYSRMDAHSAGFLSGLSFAILGCGIYMGETQGYDGWSVVNAAMGIATFIRAAKYASTSQEHDEDARAIGRLLEEDIHGTRY